MGNVTEICVTNGQPYNSSWVILDSQAMFVADTLSSQPYVMARFSQLAQMKLK